MPGIEFVDPEPEPGPDEELDTGPRRPARPGRRASPRTTRVVRTAAGAILASLAGLTLVGYLQHVDGGSAGHSAASTPSSFGTVHVDVGSESAGPASTGLVPSTPGTSIPPGTSTTPAGAPTEIDTTCPVADACAVSSSLPAAVTDALRARLPGISEVAGTSVLVVGPRPTLRTRRVTARTATLAVAVEIHPATRYDHPRAATLTNDRSGLVYARALTHGLAVTVSLSGPPGQEPGPATARALARDPRLLAVQNRP